MASSISIKTPSILSILLILLSILLISKKNSADIPIVAMVFTIFFLLILLVIAARISPNIAEIDAVIILSPIISTTIIIAPPTGTGAKIL